MASPRFGHPHSQNPSDTASYPDVSLSMKMCWQRKREGQNGLRLPSVPFPWSLAIHHQSLAITVRKTKRLRRSVLVIWASPVTLTLTLTQIAKVIWEGGDAHITIGFWEWGCQKRGDAHITVTAGYPVHKQKHSRTRRIQLYCRLFWLNVS